MGTNPYNNHILEEEITMNIIDNLLTAIATYASGSTSWVGFYEPEVPVELTEKKEEEEEK